MNGGYDLKIDRNSILRAVRRHSWNEKSSLSLTVQGHGTGSEASYFESAILNKTKINEADDNDNDELVEMMRDNR